MLSAHNTVKAGSGWSRTVQQRGGPRYQAWCRSAVPAAGPSGLLQGDAVVTYSGDLGKTTLIRCVIQAITIAYLGETMTPAAPKHTYEAVRAALNQADALQLNS